MWQSLFCGKWLITKEMRQRLNTKRLLRSLGQNARTHRILRVYADREFGSYELFAYLLENKIDFHIRLKTSHKSGGRSFLQIWRNATEKVKLKGKVKIEVFGLEIYVIRFQLRNYAIASSQAVIKYSNDVIELIAFSEKV